MKKKIDELLKEISNVGGVDFIDVSKAVLIRLRSDFHGDNALQDNINEVLTMLYGLK